MKERQQPTKQVQRVLSMPTSASYDVLQSFQDIHRVVINLAGELNDEQLRWKPEGYSTSIGFHLWHLARESDYLKAALLQYYPEIGSEFGDGIQIWQRDGLAQKWGFPPGLYETVGTGLSDETAALLPIPKKEELLGYLHASYKAIEAFVELLDSKYANFNGVSEELRKQVEKIRLNLLVFLTHDCRHLGMMECLKGLQTGFGSATEKR
ncbi:MAG TPA: DinB family protein [Anaerolineales bacterium]|nr:DinB family protein [Anaerolineales bacterium]